ncbi:MAG: DUF2304 domain-containing protein [bacterium]
MPWITRIMIAAFSSLVLLVIIQFVRRKKLDERQALLWVLSGIVMILAPLLIPGIDRLSRAIGIDYPPAFAFLLAFFAMFFLALQFSVSITRLTKQNRRLAERLALLEYELKRSGG